jgi:hypothetical protein
MDNSPNEVIIYQTEDGSLQIDVQFDRDTVWLSLNQMAELFQRDKSVISRHIKNIFTEGELEENSVVAKNATTAADGKTYQVDYYNLDVIISVGYRVKSQQGTRFRIWATKRLKEYMIKGFTLDDERLKGNRPNYFEELMQRIRDIRTSERNFYQKVKEIFRTSVDYNEDADTTREFFAMIQNKFHWAVHNHTAAEIIATRADAEKPNMGLTNWAGAKIRKTDVVIAKNYLKEEELKQLNILVEQYLIFAEAQAMQRKVMYMRDWLKKLHDILTINDRDILMDAGRITAKLAEDIALKEFEKYRQQQLKEEIKRDLLDSLDEDLKRLM